MAAYTINDSTLSSIANAIRLKDGIINTMTPIQMAQRIENLPENNDKAFIERTLIDIENSEASFIGPYAFYGWSSLKTVNFPNVTTIKSQAFAYCRSLQSVYCSNLLSIGSDAFIETRSLSSFNCSMVTSIGVGAFQSGGIRDYSNANITLIDNITFAECRYLSSISFPEVSRINWAAFRGCSSLTSIYLPKVQLINSCAFQNCNKIQSLSLPLISSIGSYAFQSCTSLTSISMPLVYSISDAAFSDTSVVVNFYNLSQLNTIGSQAFCGKGLSTDPGSTYLSNSTVRYISQRAFFNNYRLTSISLTGITRIGDEAFASCSVRRCFLSLPYTGIIYSSAFMNCLSLSYCFLSFSTYGTIYDYAFNNCLSLTTIYINCTQVITLSGDYIFDKSTLKRIYVPNSLVNSYKANSQWSNLQSIIYSYNFT